VFYARTYTRYQPLKKQVYRKLLLKGWTSPEPNPHWV